MQVIDIQQKLDSFDDHWSPRVIAALNGQHVKVVKLLGEFDWHFHKDEDELFMVVEGELTIHFRDRTIELTRGQMCVIPRGIEHKPAASKESQVLLFEPAGTINTGNLVNQRTVSSPDSI